MLSIRRSVPLFRRCIFFCYQIEITNLRVFFFFFIQCLQPWLAFSIFLPVKNNLMLLLPSTSLKVFQYFNIQTIFFFFSKFEGYKFNLVLLNIFPIPTIFYQLYFLFLIFITHIFNSTIYTRFDLYLRDLCYTIFSYFFDIQSRRLPFWGRHRAPTLTEFSRMPTQRIATPSFSARTAPWPSSTARTDYFSTGMAPCTITATITGPSSAGIARLTVSILLRSR